MGNGGLGRYGQGIYHEFGNRFSIRNRVPGRKGGRNGRVRKSMFILRSFYGTYIYFRWVLRGQRLSSGLARRDGTCRLGGTNEYQGRHGFRGLPGIF